MDLDKVFARNLERVRIARGYTHENLAIDAEIARSYIWNLTKGTSSATLEMVEKLARTLGVEPWLLLVSDLTVESVSDSESATNDPIPALPPLKVVKNQTSKRKLRG